MAPCCPSASHYGCICTSLLTCRAAAHFYDWLVVGWSFSRNGDNQMWSASFIQLTYAAHIYVGALINRLKHSHCTCKWFNPVLQMWNCNLRIGFSEVSCLSFHSLWDRFRFLWGIQSQMMASVPMVAILYFCHVIMYCTRLVLHRHHMKFLKFGTRTT